MEPTSDETGRPDAVRRRPPVNPDTRPFWLKDLKAPVIREPSPVLGAHGLAPAPAEPVPVTPAPVTPAAGAPVPAPRLRQPDIPTQQPPQQPSQQPPPVRQAVDLSVPVRTPAEPVDLPTVAVVDLPAAPPPARTPLPRRRDLARRTRSRRVRPATVLGAAGALVVVLGLGLPFLLNRPFGDESVTITPSSPTPSGPVSGGTPTSRVTTYTPTASGPASPAATTTSATSTRTRTTTRAARVTAAPTTVRTVTRTVVATKPPRRTTTPATTTPGEVFIDSKDYAGRPLLDVRNDLLDRGVTPVDNWVHGTGKPYGTVVEIRPSGWVADRSVVYVWVAAS